MRHCKLINLLLFLLPLTAAAQATAPGYRNVLPDADGKTVRNALRNQKLLTIPADSDTLTMKDRFAGIDCTVAFPKNTRNPYEAWITVSFPDKKSWKGILKEYNTLEKELTALHGEPSYERKEFQNETVMGRHPDRINDLLDGYYTWQTIWDGPQGCAILSMTSLTDTARIFNTITYIKH